MSTSITNFVKTEVYPCIDINDCGFMEEYHPKKTGESFLLDCPFCGVKHKAYHYPGSGYVKCNRENNCGESGSFWDILMIQGMSKSSALKELAECAGVSLPEDGIDSKSKRDLVGLVKKALRKGMEKSERAQDYMKATRKWEQEEIDAAPFGYIHEVEYFYNTLKSGGFDASELEAWGFEKLLKTSEDKSLFEFSFNQRIVGWWEQEDGSLRLWGRDITGRREMKYRYQEGLKKTMPCYWSEEVNKEGRDNLVFVEGPIDAARLMVNGVASVAIGGASVSSGMATYIAPRLSGYSHWVDNDIAGHKGGVSSIIQTAKYGVYSQIICMKSGDGKDADEMIGCMHLVKVVEKMEMNSIGCGEYLSERFMEANAFAENSTPSEKNTILEKAKGYYRKLNGLAKTEFFQALQKEGFLLEKPELEAVRAYGNMLDVDILPHVAERIVKERFGYIVKVYSNE